MVFEREYEGADQEAVRFQTLYPYISSILTKSADRSDSLGNIYQWHRNGDN